MTDQVATRIERELGAARTRTLALLEPLDDADLVAQHSPLMSPLVWDLAHVANYEDIWLLRALGDAGVGAQHDHLYDAFRHARRDRPELALLQPAAARRYGGDVRSRVLDLLARTDLHAGDRLQRDGFVYGMVAQHEQQHDETILATLSLIDDGYRPSMPPSPAILATPTERDVLVPAGPFLMGTDDSWAYDNERPAHEVDLPAFRIDTAPVTNAEYLAFIDDGGYDDPRWWHPDGWSWRQDERAAHPLHWIADGGTWARERYGWVELLPPDEPVQHVCWYEADAYARWSGARLPTEAEWEKAAAWDPARGAARRHPWGDEEPTPAHATLGGTSFGPSRVGAHPEGASAHGCVQMLGDVWEWTASDLAPYPGFEAFPYREYTEVFFGPEHKVLRGGSWATAPVAARCTFRNWDLPIRRQIFAGFRCARDAA
jgi:iron(II)-dependent oxidoreductase